MSTAIQARLKASLKAFEKFKEAKAFSLAVDKQNTNVDTYLLFEANVERINSEIDIVKGHINRYETGMTEWSALIRKAITPEQQQEANEEFEKFAKEQKIDDTFAKAIQYLQDLLDMKAKMLATSNMFRDKAERDHRAEIRSHNQLLAAIPQLQPANATPGTQTMGTFYQLPMLKIKPFKGDRREWPAFYEAFNNAIDKKPGSKIEKMNLLRTLLQGEPETLIAGLRLDDDNYDSARKMLEAAYGDKGSYIRTLHTDLANLKRCQTLEDTQQFLMELERLAREMANIKENIEGPAIYLALEKKLNKNFLRVILARKAEDPDGWSTTLFRETLREAVRTETRIKEVAAEYGLEKQSSSGNKGKSQPNQSKTQHVTPVTSGPGPKRKGKGKGQRGPERQPPQATSTSPSHQTQMNQGHQGQTRPQQRQYGQSKGSQFKGQARPQQGYPQWTQRPDNRQPNQRFCPSPCAFCGGEHWHARCEKYSTVQQRQAVAKEKGLCLRCLRTGHTGANCPRPHKCYNCGMGHPTALCRNGPNQRSTMSSLMDQPQQNESAESHHSQKSTSTQQCNAVQSKEEHVLLMTLRCTIFNPSDPKRSMVAVVFLDAGAQRSFIGAEAAERLGLKSFGKEECNLSAFGDQNPKLYVTDRMRLGFLCNGGDRMTISLSKVKFMVNDLPVISVDRLTDYELYADKLKLPDQFSRPDILLGMDVWPQLYYREEHELPSGFLVCNTILGRLLAGTGEIIGPTPPSKVTFVLPIQENALQDQSIVEEKDLELESRLHTFFGLNTVGMEETETSPKDEEVLQKFKENLTFIKGRYQIGLPFNDRVRDLPTNFRQAKARLISTIRKLRELNLIDQYQAIFDEQLRNGVIELVDDPKQNSGPVHYLPHRAVVREDKETTKIRIVLDASARPKGIVGAPSLNDCLHTGPMLLNELVGILLRFRRMKKLVIADIEKAFLQLGVREQDRDCTRLLWVKDPYNVPLDQFMETIVYRFCRVSFGLTVSPFLLNATIREHLSLYDDPLANVILANLYSDNTFINIDPLQAVQYKKSRLTTKEICEEAKQMFDAGGMKLRQFFCSHPSEIAALPAEDLARDQRETKVLGIKWNNATDLIQLTIPVFHGKATKRKCLSQIAQPYDPMGLISPALLPCKLFMRKLYEAEYKWDDPLKDNLQMEWRQLMSDWMDIYGNPLAFDFPRLIEGTNMEIHCFVDASGSGLGLATYARTQIQNMNKCYLLFGKSLVKPAKISTQDSTIPKMELQALALGVKTCKFIQKQMELESTQITLWSDSHCSIDRVKDSKKYDRFVMNRVKKIRGHFDINHVKGEHNPADVASRGGSPTELLENERWKQGPEWLCKPKEDWPKPMVTYYPGEELNKENELDDVTFEIHAVEVQTNAIDSVINPIQFSNWPKLLHTLAYVFRFIDNTKNKRLKIRKTVDIDWTQLKAKIPPLEYNELRKAEHYLIQKAQEEFPATEAQKRDLQLFEMNGLWHCQGRINEAKIRRMEKTPILLPKQAWITKLLILQAHQKEGKHSGSSTVLAMIRQRFWIPQGRKTIDKIVQKNCLVCRKFRLKAYEYPPMPGLPKDRILRERPFGRCGVDYFGPVRLKLNNDEQQKHFVALYTCLVTRAIHLELAEDYSAAAFLNTFRRFCARRGKPAIMYSDNAGNFTLGAKIIQELWEKAIIEETAQQGIQWTFITPRAPWKGGAWERMVGVTKNALKRSIGRAIPRTEEYSTLLCEVESIVNSRPLTFLSDKNMIKPLRPIDFLLPFNDVEIQLPSLDEDPADPDYNPSEKANARELGKMLRSANKRLDNFWRLWREDYLLSLREKSVKQSSEGKCIPREGDVVIVDQGEEKNRAKWPLAIIVRLVGGRTAKIFSNGRYFSRAVNQLYPLEMSDSNDNRIIDRLPNDIIGRINIFAVKETVPGEIYDEDEDAIPMGCTLDSAIRNEIEKAKNIPEAIRQFLIDADKYYIRKGYPPPKPSAQELWNKFLMSEKAPCNIEKGNPKPKPPPPTFTLSTQSNSLPWHENSSHNVQTQSAHPPAQSVPKFNQSQIDSQSLVKDASKPKSKSKITKQLGSIKSQIIQSVASLTSSSSSSIQLVTNVDSSSKTNQVRVPTVSINCIFEPTQPIEKMLNSSPSAKTIQAQVESTSISAPENEQNTICQTFVNSLFDTMDTEEDQILLFEGDMPEDEEGPQESMEMDNSGNEPCEEQMNQSAAVEQLAVPTAPTRKPAHQAKQPRWFARAKPFNKGETVPEPEFRTPQWFNANFTIPTKNPLVPGKYRINQRTGKVEKTPRTGRIAAGGFNMLARALKTIDKPPPTSQSVINAERKIGQRDYKSRKSIQQRREEREWWDEHWRLFQEKYPSRPPSPAAPISVPSPKEKERRRSASPSRRQSQQQPQNRRRSNSPRRRRSISPRRKHRNDKSSKPKKTKEPCIFKAEPAQERVIDIGLLTPCDGPEHANCPKNATLEKLAMGKMQSREQVGFLATTLLKATLMFWLVRLQPFFGRNYVNVLNEGLFGQIEAFWAKYWQTKHIKANFPKNKLKDVVQIWSKSCNVFAEKLSIFRYGPLHLQPILIHRSNAEQQPAAGFEEFLCNLTTEFEGTIDIHRRETYFPLAYHNILSPTICVGEWLGQFMADSMGKNAKWFSHDWSMRLSTKLTPSFKSKRINLCLEPENVNDVNENFALSLEESKAAWLEVNIVLAKQRQPEWKAIKAKTKQLAQWSKAGLYIFEGKPHEMRKIIEAIEPAPVQQIAQQIANESTDDESMVDPEPSTSQPSTSRGRMGFNAIGTMLGLILLLSWMNPCMGMPIPIWKPWVIEIEKRGEGANVHYQNALGEIPMTQNNLPTDPQERERLIQEKLALIREAHAKAYGYPNKGDQPTAPQTEMPTTLKSEVETKSTLPVTASEPTTTQVPQTSTASVTTRRMYTQSTTGRSPTTTSTQLATGRSPTPTSTVSKSTRRTYSPTYTFGTKFTQTSTPIQTTTRTSTIRTTTQPKTPSALDQQSSQQTTAEPRMALEQTVTPQFDQIVKDELLKEAPAKSRKFGRRDEWPSLAPNGKPAMVCSHRGGTLWTLKLGEQSPFCKPPPSLNAEWRNVTIQLYGQIIKPQVIPDALHCSAKRLSEEHYTNWLGDPINADPTKELLVVGRAECKKMAAQKKCEFSGDSLTKEGSSKLWKTHQTLHKNFPGRFSSFINGPIPSISINCFLQPAPLYLRPHNLQLLSPIHSVEDCSYSSDFCPLSDNSSIIWESKCPQGRCRNCDFEYLENLSGEATSNTEYAAATFISRNREQALTFSSKAKQVTACDGKQIRISDQGFGIPIEDFEKLRNATATRRRRQTGYVDQQQIAAQLTATQLATSRSLAQLFRRECQRNQRNDNPTLQARQLLRNDLVMARWISDSAIEVFGCAPIELKDIALRSSETCHSFIPIHVRFRDHKYDAFLDPILRIIAANASISDCSIFRTHYIETQPGNWIKIDTKNGISSPLDSSSLHELHESLSEKLEHDMHLTPVIFHDWHLHNSTDFQLFAHISEFTRYQAWKEDRESSPQARANSINATPGGVKTYIEQLIQDFINSLVHRWIIVSCVWATFLLLRDFLIPILMAYLFGPIWYSFRGMIGMPAQNPPQRPPLKSFFQNRAQQPRRLAGEEELEDEVTTPKTRRERVVKTGKSKPEKEEEEMIELEEAQPKGILKRSPSRKGLLMSLGQQAVHWRKKEEDSMSGGSVE